MRTKGAILALTLSLPLLLAGCLLLSPDEERPGTELRFVVRADESTLGKVPCAVPAQLLLEDPESENPEGLLAKATILRPEGQDLVPIATVPLSVSEVTAGERTLSGQLDFDAEMGQEDYVLDVSLYYRGPTNRRIEGLYEGSIRLASGLDVTVESFNVTPGPEAVIVVSAAGLTSDPTAVEIDFDAEANLLEASYTSEAFVWEGETERGRVEMTARFLPTLIYRTQVTLSEVLPNTSIEQETVVLEPVDIPATSPAVPLHMELDGSIRVFLATAPPNVRETGVLHLFRQGTACN